MKLDFKPLSRYLYVYAPLIHTLTLVIIAIYPFLS